MKAKLVNENDLFQSKPDSEIKKNLETLGVYHDVQFIIKYYYSDHSSIDDEEYDDALELVEDVIFDAGGEMSTIKDNSDFGSGTFYINMPGQNISKEDMIKFIDDNTYQAWNDWKFTDSYELK